jgi:hypothetical protein
MINHLNNGQSQFSDRSQLHTVAECSADHFVRSRSAIAGGYAFESALSFVESQSPLLRPASIRPGNANAEIAECEVQELSSRVMMLTTLLDGVRGQLNSEDAMLLSEAAGRVADELVELFGAGAERVSIDPSAPHDRRREAAKALMSAWYLQDKIRTGLRGGNEIAEIRQTATWS